VNRLGTWFGLVALSLAVFDHTHSALAVAALLFAWQALPAFVVPAVVARIEASRRGGELSGLYFFEAIVTAMLAVLLWHFWLPAVLLLATLDGTAALAASALLRAGVARAAREQVETELGDTPNANGLVGEKHSAAGDISLENAVQEAERKANAALNVAFSTTFVLGPVLGGAVVATAGAPAALFIDVGSFLICGALLLDLHPHVEEAEGDPVRARMRAAWRHINEAPSLRTLLLVEAVALVFSESVGPVEVAYAKTTLHAGDRGYGLLLTAWGAGAVLGSLVFARSLRRPLGAMLSVGTLAAGLAYVGFAAAPSLLVACVAALIGGIGNGMEVPSLTSIVQRITPRHLHGRMMGAIESLVAVCIAIGLPLGGVLVALRPRSATAPTHVP
jgi:MFS family permease